MAYSSTDVMVPAHGTVLFAPADTVPIDPAQFDYTNPVTYTGWVAGYTSKKSLPQISKDGGELKSIDAWEADALLSSKSPTTFTLKVAKIQIDEANLTAAFPGGVWDAAMQSYAVRNIGTVTKAVQIIAFDGNGQTMSIYAGRVQLTLGDMPEFDTENFFQISVTGSINLDGKGNRMIIFKPRMSVPKVAPTISSVSPADATAGSTITITGSALTGTTSVLIGSTPATSIQVIDDTKVTAVMPAGSAGSTTVTATNAVGVSDAYSYTRGA